MSHRRLVGRAVTKVSTNLSLAAAAFVGLAMVAGSSAVNSGARPMLVAGHRAQLPGIYFAPTPQPVVESMLKLARVAADDVVYDLGSGDGRIVVIAAQRYGARGVGVELRSDLVAISRQVAREGGVADRTTFIEGDMFTTDISEATVVTLWLSETINVQLEPKLKRELRPGARIVSRQFRIGNWTPEQIVRVDNEDLFLWTISR
jgi:SAM-dependent methyltransferase